MILPCIVQDRCKLTTFACEISLAVREGKQKTRGAKYLTTTGPSVPLPHFATAYHRGGLRPANHQIIFGRTMSESKNNRLDEVSEVASFSKLLSFFLSLNLNPHVETLLIQGDEALALRKRWNQNVAWKVCSAIQDKKSNCVHSMLKEIHILVRDSSRPCSAKKKQTWDF